MRRLRMYLPGMPAQVVQRGTIEPPAFRTRRYLLDLKELAVAALTEGHESATALRPVGPFEDRASSKRSSVGACIGVSLFGATINVHHEN